MTQSGGGQWADLGQRFLSGGVAAVIGLTAMWLGGITFHILIALICGIMVWELVRMIGAPDKAVLLGTIAGVALFAAVELPDGFALPLILLPALLGATQTEEHRLTYTLYTAAILIAGFGLVALRDDFGFSWMAWLALVVIATDIMGYFAGKYIGGPKFWPKVSPKKTWSGTVGGWVAAAAVGAFFGGWPLILVSVVTSFFSQMGDAAESAIKRRTGVKDSSNLIPGHGGLMDRFDALMGASLFIMLVGAIVGLPTGQ